MEAPGMPMDLRATGYEHTLPFFKAFYAGGPNSMRAWQVRNLGLGSSKYYSDSYHNNTTCVSEMSNWKAMWNTGFCWALCSVSNSKVLFLLILVISGAGNPFPIFAGSREVISISIVSIRNLLWGRNWTENGFQLFSDPPGLVIQN